MQSEKKTIAIVVPAFASGGGVPTIAAFLHQVISTSEHYSPTVISLSTSARDSQSIRLLSPSTWFRGIRSTQGLRADIPYIHFGAAFSELEFQRYRPRRELTQALNQFDLVHVVAGAPMWALVAKDYKGPVVLQAATLTGVERRSLFQRTRGFRRTCLKLMTKISTRLEESALKTVDVVFVINSWMQEHVGKRIGPQKVVFALPGVDTEHFQPGNEAKAGYILSVGRLGDSRKNVKLLFEAYQQVRQRQASPPKLVLAGKTAPAESDWEHARRLGVAEFVEFHEGVSFDGLRDLYQSALFFVLSSDEEGLGIVILEAMSCGLAVVGTRCGGPETVVIEGETGYLSPVGDASALATNMCKLIDEPMQREKMGEKAREIAEEQFSFKATTKRYLDAYDSLLNRG